MSRQTRFPRKAAGLVLALALAGCGSEANDPLSTFGSSLLERFRPGEAARPILSIAEVRALVTDDVLAALGGQALIAENRNIPGAYLLVRVGTANGNEVWRSSTNIEISLTGQGLMFGTRGYGNDLMSADVSQSAQALAQGRAGTVERLHVYLTGNLQSRQRFFDCEIAFDGNIATELCRGGAESFENTYVLGGGGRVLRSTQWVGPEIGFITLERVAP